jgi:hypothetical protein
MNKCREKLKKCAMYIGCRLVHLYTYFLGSPENKFQESECEVNNISKKDKLCSHCEMKYIPDGKKSIIYSGMNFCSVPCMLQFVSKPYL